MFKNVLFVVAGMLIAVIVLGVAGFAYAQTQTPDGLFGQGRMGGRGTDGAWKMGGRGGMMGSAGQGLLHDYMLQAWADAFEMKVEDLQARLDQGDTMWTIAQEKGLSQEAFYQLRQEVRSTAIQAAVADGVITQEQADWMLSHQGGRGGRGAGGACPGMDGSGRGPRFQAPQVTETAG